MSKDDTSPYYDPHAGVLYFGRLAAQKRIADRPLQVGPREKPPLGVNPRKLWDEQRLCELSGAVNRYLDARYQVPEAWLLELEELSRRHRASHYSTPGAPQEIP